ncbi:MAG: hypothetical protein AAGC54_05710 [Cyanobacteria bacterium P01_F01_bin.4]
MSLGLHGVLLFMPARDIQRPGIEDPDAPEEEPIIEVQSLADIIGAQPKVPPPEAPPPEPPTQVLEPPQQQVLTEVPEELPPEELLEEEFIEEPVEADPFEADPAAPDEDPGTNFNPGDAQAQLSGNFGSLSGATGLEPAPTTFPNAYQDAFFQPNADGTFSLTSSRYPSIAGWEWLNDTRPENALPEVQQLVANSQQTMTLAGEYGGGELYQLADSTGNQVGFLNVVPGEGRISTIMVIWARDPRV